MSGPELRVDPLTGLRVLVAGDRADRPGGLPPVDARDPIDVTRDPFAEGNEGQTPPETWADRPIGQPDSPGWRVRVVPNKYAALISQPDDLSEYPHSAGSQPSSLDPQNDPLASGHGQPLLLTSAPAVGIHEVVVNSPRQVSSLADLTVDELELAMAAWRTRMSTHYADERISYVHLIVNEGQEAGASLPHTHAQIYGLPFVPAAIGRERERFSAYHDRTQGQNLLEDLVVEEIRVGERVVCIDDEAVLLVPFAARTPYQMMLVPRRPAARFEDDGPLCAAMLADALGRLTRLFGNPPPINIWVRTAPRGTEAFCWRIDLLPRLGQPAGMELGTGVFINSVTPETAARHLREV